MIHDLKCWPEYFQAVKSGIKPFELRKDDRGFAVGDVLHLREFDPDTALYTGDEIDKTVTYVLPTKLFGAIGEGAKYVIMGLAPRDWTPCAEGLPGKETDNVLVCFLDKFGFMEVSIGWYWIPNEKWYTDAKSSPVDVIAWQPLPAPYRADDTTGKVKEN